MAADVVPYFRPQFFDANGKPLAGGKVYTYKAGTTTPLVTYKDAGFTQNTNPIVLESDGSADIFIGVQPVKFVIFDANDVLIKTVDNVTGPSGSTIGVQTVVPITTNGSQTTFAIGVDPEVKQNCTVVVQPTVGNRIVYMTTEFSISGQNLTFNTAPPAGTGEIRIGHTRAIAASGLSDGSVSTIKIQNLAVTNAKLADDSVGTPKIQDLAVTTPKLEDLSVTTAKLASNAVTNAKIAAVDKWAIGNIQMHHTFGGAAPIARGWMICANARVIQADYDSIHGAGAWVADGVAASPLVNKYLPNLVGKYAYGTQATSQTGTAPMTSTGNAGSTINLAHTHQWYKNSPRAVFDSTGSQVVMFNVPLDGGEGINAEKSSVNNTSASTIAVDLYTDSRLSSAVNIQPESISVLYIVKVI